MSIAALLQAAEYLERREREAEHGYASSLPMPDNLRNTKRPKTKKTRRTTHNELEKNRRAHLRNCLEKLKEMVPLGPDVSRHTTLGLLTKAKNFIKTLEDKEKKQLGHKEHLFREQRYLRRRLEQLTSKSSTKRRSNSECSTSTTTSSASNSEADEVDVIGYVSNQSDTDDHSSIQSASSDSGVAMSTHRLTILEMELDI